MEQLVRPLVPEDKLYLTVAVKVPEDAVMVLMRPAILNNMPLPGSIRPKMGIGVLPPIDIASLVVIAANDIQVAVSVDVMEGAARLDGDALFFYGIEHPAI